MREALSHFDPEAGSHLSDLTRFRGTTARDDIGTWHRRGRNSDALEIGRRYAANASPKGSVDPLTGHLFSVAAEDRARQIVSDIAKAVLPCGPARSGIVAGITGLTRDTPAEATMRALLADRLRSCRPTKVFVAEDMWIAYLSYFALGEGILDL